MSIAAKRVVDPMQAFIDEVEDSLARLKKALAVRWPSRSRRACQRA